MEEVTGRPSMLLPPRPRGTAAGDVAADVPRRLGAWECRRRQQQEMIAVGGGGAGMSLPQMKQWGHQQGLTTPIVALARDLAAADKATGRPRQSVRARTVMGACLRRQVGRDRSISYGMAAGISAQRGLPYKDVAADELRGAQPAILDEAADERRGGGARPAITEEAAGRQR